MLEAECPYCEKTNYYELEDLDLDEDAINNLECESCEKGFIATVYHTMGLRNEKKAPCLNGEKHKYKKVYRYPIVVFERVKVRCEWCSDELNVDHKTAHKYGYDQGEVNNSFEEEKERRK